MPVSRFRQPLGAAFASFAFLVLMATTVAAQPPANTPVGNPTIVLTDPMFVDGEARWFGSRTPITLTFSSVTAEGTTWLESRADLVPPLPAGLQAGSPPFYYDLHSTAAFEGSVAVCFDIRGMSFPRPNEELQIYTATGNTWTPLDNQNATSNGLLCGDAPALGTFAIFYAQVAATAIATFAGTGVAQGALDGPGGDPRDDFSDNVPATQSALTQPGRLTHDAAGNIYVMEVTTRIRRIDASGTITTIVPSGVCADWPIAVDTAGRTLYCVQWSHTRAGWVEIVSVDLGNASHSIFVAELPEVLAMVVSADGDLFYSEGSTGSIYRVPAGTQNSQLIFSYGRTLAPLTLTDWERIFTLAFDGENHLLAGGFTLIRIAPGADGRVDGSTDETVARIAGLGASQIPSFSKPLSGDGLPASQALLMLTHQMIVASDGAVVFADSNGRVRRIDPGVDGIVNGGVDEIVRTVAGYYHPRWWMWLGTVSGFATSEHLQFLRGVLEDPRSPGAFIISSALGHKLQRIGQPAGDGSGPLTTDISVEVTDTPDPVDAEASLTYTAVVRNRGSRAARAALTMPISAADVSSVIATSPAGFCTVPVLFLVPFGNVVCDAGLIAQGAQVVITVQVTPKRPGTLSATFTVTGDQDDEVPANNTATVTTTVVERVPPTAIITAPASIALGASLSASADGSTDSGGGQIVRYRWTLVERNLFVETSVPTVTFLVPRGNPLTVGAYQVELVVVDDSGNVSTPASAIVQIVELAPANDAYTVSQGTTLASTLGAVAEFPFLRGWTESLINVNGSLFFIDGAGRLNRTNGTAGGLTLLKPPNVFQSREPRAVGATVFFAAEDSTHGMELWKSDGTLAGTVLVKDIAPGWHWSWPSELTDVGGTLFFVVDGIDPMTGSPTSSEIWRSDGTAAGTSLVKRFKTSGELFLRNVGGTLYFRVPGGPDRGLWKSDGTADGTIRVKDIVVEGQGVLKGSRWIRNWYPDTPVVVGDKLFFLGRETPSATQALWMADSHGASVFMPAIDTVERQRVFLDFSEANGRLYFSVVDTEFSQTTGNVSIAREVWSSDGTPEGTALVKKFGPALEVPRGETPFFFTASGDYVYFLQRGNTLWRTDGTPAGTIELKSAIQIWWASEGFRTGMTDVDGTLYFYGESASGNGVWKSDGTPASTVLAKPLPLGYAAFNLTSVNGVLYFTMCDETGRGYEVWMIGRASGVLANDVIRAPLPVSAAVLQPPSHGAFSFNAAGTFVYRPHDGFSGDDQFTYTLTDGTVISAAATVTIHVVRDLPSLSIADAFVQEGHSGSRSLTFTVTRSGDQSESTTVAFNAGGGSADAGIDYEPVSGTLTFAPGEMSQQVVVPVFGDAIDEPDEVLFLNFTDPIGATLARTRAFGTVVGDDFDADLEVAVTVTPDPPTFGESLTYQVVVVNHGPRNATGVSLTMPVSASSVSSVSATSPAGFCTVPVLVLVPFGNVACDAGSIAAGAQVTLTVTVTPKNLGVLGATFTVSGSQTDPTSANNVATVSTRVVELVPPTAVLTVPPSIALGASVSASAAGSTDAGGGQIVRYRWTLVERNLFVETSVPTVTFLVPRGNPLTVGGYQVELVVVDDSGNLSAPAMAAVHVVDFKAVDDDYTVQQDSTLASAHALLTQFPYRHLDSLGPMRTLANGNGTLYFGAWKSDGTPAGTHQLSIGGMNHTTIGTTVFFTGRDSHGLELWKTDGTAAGTVLVKDILPGSEGSNPRELTNVNGTLFFIIDTIDPLLGVIGAELWRSDGTGAGTFQVKTFPTFVDFLRNVDGTLFFTRAGRELWKSDGTPEGTVLVKSIRVDGDRGDYKGSNGNPWFPDTPVALNGRLIFLGSDHFSGSHENPDLWKADATAGGSLLLARNSPPGSQRVFLDLAVINGRLYFGVLEYAVGTCTPISDGFPICNYIVRHEVWTSDGTAEGSTLLKTFGPVTAGGPGGSPFFFAGSGKHAYFLSGGLWRTDGTEAGTGAVASVHVAAGPAWPDPLIDVDGTLFFVRAGGAPNSGIWKSDGTAAGTVMVKSTEPAYPAFDLTNVNGAVYFTIPYDDARGHQVWILGTAPGVLANDTLRASTPVTASVVQQVSHGTLVFNPDGKFIYRPSPGFSGDDAFTYTVSDGTVTSDPATVTIHVAATPAVISSSDATVAEGNSGDAHLTFTVTRSGDLSAPSTVAFNTAGGTAVAGTDYQALSGTLTFAPGDASQQVQIAVHGDAIDEPDEVLFLNFTDPIGATLARTRAFGTIVGDDFHADLHVAATAAPDPVLIGGTLTYQVVISNHGPRRATGIGMTMPVDPAAIASVSATSPAGACVVPLLSFGGSSPVSCDAGALAAGSSVTITVSVTPKVPGEIASTFTVSGELTDPVSGNNAATVPTSVTAPPHFAHRSGVRYPAADASGTLMPVLVQFTALTNPGLVLANPIPGPPPPTEFAFVSETFDITTTASFAGPITVCISGAALRPADRLFHFTAARWVDITTAALSSPTQVCGQSETLSPFAIMRDVTPPAVTITSPAASASHVLGELVTTQYECTDKGSGLSNCAGPVASGLAIDTASVGAKAFTVTATDVAGNVATVTTNYRVSYGVCLLYDPLKVKKSGSTVPIGLQLCDVTGRNYSSANVGLSARGVQLLASGDMGPPEDAGNANPDQAFRYDAAITGYIFNLKTTGYTPGVYGLTFTVGDDPTIRVAEFRVQ
jgi:uncharacterized repeat protein (TIGR01451 family)